MYLIIRVHESLRVIHNIQKRFIMAPKKKKLAEQPAPNETQSKPTEKSEPVLGQKKEESKAEVKPIVQPIPQVTQTPQSRLEQPIVSQQPVLQSKPEESAELKGQKIAIDDVAKLSEQDKLKLRRLRFGIVGTEATIDQAQRIRQQRLKKFGGPVVEDKETIERRKQKFGNVPDQETVKKRLEKFGTVGASVALSNTEEEAILEERRKKFGNTDALVNLDDQIKKSKPIKKFHPKFNHNKQGKPRHDNRHFRR